MLFFGINNENEFFSDHYLSEIFKGDIQQLLELWREKEELAKAAKEKLDAGASLVQVYSNFIYQGPKLVKDIVSGL